MPRYGDKDRKGGATFVVAASDSEDPDSADWACSGVADNVDLQEAIDALQS